MDVIVNGKTYTAADYTIILEEIEELMEKDTITDDELFELMELSVIADKYEAENYPIGQNERDI